MSDVPPAGSADSLNAWATKQGLTWVGGRELLSSLVIEDFWSEEVVAEHSRLFQNVRAFAKKSRGDTPDVVAVLMFPYIDDTPQLRDEVEDLAVRFGTNGRVNHKSDRVYPAEQYTVIALWADDNIDLV